MVWCLWKLFDDFKNGLMTLDNFNNNCGKITAKPGLPSAPVFPPTLTFPDPLKSKKSKAWTKKVVQ